MPKHLYKGIKGKAFAVSRDDLIKLMDECNSIYQLGLKLGYTSRNGDEPVRTRLKMEGLDYSRLEPWKIRKVDFNGMSKVEIEHELKSSKSFAHFASRVGFNKLGRASLKSIHLRLSKLGIDISAIDKPWVDYIQYGSIQSIPTDVLSDVVKKCKSNHEVVAVLGYSGTGRVIQLRERILLEGIDISHFSRITDIPRGKRGIPYSEILIENSKADRGTIKLRLLKDGLIRNECYICGIKPEWNGKRLGMVLDHINGVNNDHRLENLRMLCPNCNSQTDTFCGRNFNRIDKNGEAVFAGEIKGVKQAIHKNRIKENKNV